MNKDYLLDAIKETLTKLKTLELELQDIDDELEFGNPEFNEASNCINNAIAGISDISHELDNYVKNNE
jgi:hypothetical protein